MFHVALFHNAIGAFCCCQVQEPLKDQRLSSSTFTSSISLLRFPCSCSSVNLVCHTRNDSAHCDAGRHHLLGEVFLMCSLGSLIFPKVIMAEPRCYSLFKEDMLLLSSTKPCIRSTSPQAITQPLISSSRGASRNHHQIRARAKECQTCRR